MRDMSSPFIGVDSECGFDFMLNGICCCIPVRRPEFLLTRGGRCDDGRVATDLGCAPGVFPIPSSLPLVSSRIDVEPSMKAAIPRTMRSPLKRSTLSRALAVCQYD